MMQIESDWFSVGVCLKIKLVLPDFLVNNFFNSRPCFLQGKKSGKLHIVMVMESLSALVVSIPQIRNGMRIHKSRSCKFIILTMYIDIYVHVILMSYCTDVMTNRSLAHC